RIHREKLIEDVFGPQSEHENNLLDVSLQRIGELGGGILIYLRSGFVGVPLDHLDSGDLNERTSRETERRHEWLEIGVGAQILRDLGARHIRVLAGREMDFVGLDGFGLEVDATELLTG
ncbi:MAG: 3,4-dihydroxy-2-butanone-4-phosphate synthase, partial [Pseudomonadota bacterium]|nr:3,4-dihydroxy-2-butanone-4-phosphate synthase [Pseudomonadota bacterium]